MALENTGGTPNPGEQSGAGDNNQSGTQNTGTGPTSGANQQGGNQPKVFTYNEDRTDWTPRHRLNEESGKRQQAEQRIAAIQAELEQERRRVQALTGVTPQDPKTAEANEVKQVLSGLLQEMGLDLDTLKTLTKDEISQIRQAAAAAASNSEHTWNRHTQTAFDGVAAAAAKLIGVQKLSAKQIDNIRRAYVAEADACMAQRENAQRFGQHYDASNDFMSRHLAGDPTLFEEFAKAYVEEWATPIRRTVTAQTVRRGNRPVPSGSRTQDLTISNQPVGDLSDNNNFKKQLLAARAQNGG